MKKAKYGSGFRVYDYYKTVSRTGGVFSAFSLSCLLYIVYYLFANYILGDLKAELSTNNGLKYTMIVIGALLAVAVIAFVVRKIASKRTSALDVGLITVGVADIIIMVIKFGINGDIQNYYEVMFFAIPLACTVVISIVRIICFRPRNNYLISTHKEEKNSNIKSYYAALFKRPSTWLMAAMSIVIMLVYLLAQSKGWLDIFGTNESIKQETIKNCATLGAVAVAFLIVGLGIRLYHKTMNFMDAYVFAILPLGVMMLFSLIIDVQAVTAIISVAAIVISVGLQMLFAHTTYLTDSIVYDAPEIVEEEKEEKTEEAAEEVAATVIPVAVKEPEKEVCEKIVERVVYENPEQDEALLARIAELEKQTAFLMKLNESLESRLTQAESVLAEEKEKNKKQDLVIAEHAFIMKAIERLQSRVSQLETVGVRNSAKEKVQEEKLAHYAFILRELESLQSRLTYLETVSAAEQPEEQEVGVCDNYAFMMRTIENLQSRLAQAEWLLKNGYVPATEQPCEEEAAEEQEQPEEQTEPEVEEPEEEIEEPEQEEEEEQEEEDEDEEEQGEEPVTPESDEITWEEISANKRRAKPRFTFEMKLRIAEDKVKQFYSDIKNALLSYGMHARMSKHKENFNKGRNQIARMVINGKTLKVYLAINPNELDPKYYHHRDVSDKKGVAELPTMINVRSKVAVKKVKMLIDKIAEELVIFPKKYTPQDFTQNLTLDGFTTVERKGYGYLVKEDGVATKEEADNIPDDFATNAVEYVYAPEKASRFIKTEISLDELAKHFADGDTVTIEAVRNKGLAVVNSNFLSVGDGKKLSKKLHVYADEFSITAAKLICMAGGEAYMIVQPEE